MLFDRQEQRNFNAITKLHERIGRKRARRLAYLTSGALILGGAHGVAHAQTVTEVTPDGRTDTTITNQAGTNTTTVTTNTKSGGNALNSFSVFDVGSPDTVNLIVPEDVNALINIVRDRAVTIDGAVNSLVGGEIGGNVFFVDTHGFVVGASGSINVGSLTVVTPTSAFVDGIIDGAGGISTAALGSLMAGDVPLSSSGTVVIRGVVNAANGASFNSAGVTVAGGGAVNVGLKATNPLFQASVNTSGLNPGARLVEREGRIEIVGANIVLDGILDAPGAIAVTASDLRISLSDSLLTDTTATASISQGADGVIRGGDITLAAMADRTVVQGLAEANASVSVAGLITGENVSITADANAEASKAASLTSVISVSLDTVEGIFGDIPLFEAFATLPLPTDNVGYASIQSDASVAIAGTANIQSTGNEGVLLRSNALQTFKQTPLSGALIGLTIAKVEGNAATTVASGATIASEANLEIASHDAAIVDMQVTTSTDSAPFGLTLALLKSDVAANTAVNSGANISAAGDLSVIGRNDMSYKVVSQVEAQGSGQVGIAAAVGLTNSEATAFLDADVGQTGVAPANILVEASSVGALRVLSKKMHLIENRRQLGREWQCPDPRNRPVRFAISTHRQRSSAWS